MKICLVAPVPPPYGGISNWTKMLLENTDSCIASYSCVNTAPAKRVEVGKDYLYRIVASGISMFRIKRELCNILKKEASDVIHMTTSGSLAAIRDILLLRVAKRKHIPTVYHIRFGRIKEISDANTMEWRLIAHAMRIASEVIVIDETTYKTVKEKLPDVNVINIPNPVCIRELPTGVVSKEKTITYLGWVIKTKGIEELLVAWKSLHENHKEYRLQLIGPSKLEYMDYLHEHFSFDGVEYIGERTHNEAMSLVANSELFILPSYTEGFPNVIVEAMAMSKPIVASAVGAIPDILSENCGIVIEPKKADEIEKALIALINSKDMRETLSNNARRKAAKCYDFEPVFSKYVDAWSIAIALENRV